MKLFRHLSFWMGIVVLLTLIFGSAYQSYTEPFLFVMMLLPVVAGTSYFFNYYLVPNYLFKKKTFRFILYCCYMLVISLYLETVIITLAFIFLANYHYSNMIPLASDVSVLAITLYGIVFLYGFMLLARKLLIQQKAIAKVKQRQEEEFLMVRAERKTNKIPQKDIEYLESLGDYVKIHTFSSRPIITKEKISKLEERLPDYFLRIHRSYLINANKVRAYNKEQIQVNNVNLPISRTYKKHVMTALNKCL
jgi:two-component system, LytTR family, response regulator LytT